MFGRVPKLHDHGTVETVMTETDMGKLAVVAAGHVFL
jgi:hypothetical protein